MKSPKYTERLHVAKISICPEVFLKPQFNVCIVIDQFKITEAVTFVFYYNPVWLIFSCEHDI